MSLITDCSPAVDAAVAKSTTLHPAQPQPIRGVAYARRWTGGVLPQGGPNPWVVELHFADGTSRVFRVVCGVGISTDCFADEL